MTFITNFMLILAYCVPWSIDFQDLWRLIEFYVQFGPPRNRSSTCINQMRISGVIQLDILISTKSTHTITFSHEAETESVNTTSHGGL